MSSEDDVAELIQFDFGLEEHFSISDEELLAAEMPATLLCEDDNLISSNKDTEANEFENANRQQNENGESSRFATLSSAEIESLKRKSINSNTCKTTKTWYNVYASWAEARNERKNMENIPPTELNTILERFYAEVCKKDGSDYEPESLGVMQASLDRYLKERNYSTSIVRGGEFYTSNLALKGKATQLRESGKGSRPNASKPLTAAEEEELWQSGKLGSSNPESLLHTVWYLTTQYFGFRGCQEHNSAEIPDFQLSKDENGTEFLEFNDSRPSKTRPGGVRVKRRAQRPRMYANDSPRCPVAIFKEYLARRPPELQNNGPLYLAVINNPKSSVWYKKLKMGQNRIGQIMKKIVANTSLEGSKRLTNHSGRKTVVKKLDDADVPRDKIMAVTGHRNVKSLDDYVDSMNSKQAHELSNIISGGSKDLQVAHGGEENVAFPKNPKPLLQLPSFGSPSVPDHSMRFPAMFNFSAISENSTVNINFTNSFNSDSNSASSMISKSVSPARIPFKRIRRIVESDDEDEN